MDLKRIEHLENEYSQDGYYIKTGNLIYSSVRVEYNETLDNYKVFLYFDTYQDGYQSEFILKKNKLVNFLLRAEKEFENFSSKNSVPTLSTMENLFKNYLVKG